MTSDFDVVVVGNGLAGVCAAALLVRHAQLSAQRVALLAPALPTPAAAAMPELRVVALSRASERVLQAAQAWSLLDAQRLCSYQRMCVWHESSSAEAAASLCFDAAEIGEPNLGTIVENGALLRACLASFVAAGGVLLDAQLTDAAWHSQQVQLSDSKARTFSTALLVGADGAQSLVRERAGLALRTHDYRQRAIVATVHTERAHEHTAWQCFLGSGPLAFLPLFDGSSSIVWSLERALAEQLQHCPEAQFNQRLHDGLSGRLGASTLASERLSFPLHSLSAQAYVRERCALIGDAAHVIHPLAGQGANLGLLDAAALCEAVGAAREQHEDPGALRVLRAYEQQRRTHNLMADAAMSALQSGFSRTSAPAAWLINRGLSLVNASAGLKRLLARSALGSSGALPRLARAQP